MAKNRSPKEALVVQVPASLVAAQAHGAVEMTGTGKVQEGEGELVRGIHLDVQATVRLGSRKATHPHEGDAVLHLLMRGRLGGRGARGGRREGGGGGE